MTTPDRWAEVQNILHEALVHEPRSREEYLARACADDSTLRHEVEELLQAHARSGMLDEMADTAMAPLVARLRMPSNPLTPQLPHYTMLDVYTLLKRFDAADRALGYLRQGEERTRECQLSIQRSFHLAAIAHIYLQQGMVEDCLRVYREAAESSRKARHADGLAQALRTLGEVLYGLGRYDEALPLFEEGTALLAQLEDHRGEALMWSRIAAIHERTSAFAEASSAWERARAQ